VIVDEAQNLAPMVLEQLRLLSNLETETEKLLQIALVGQPELRGILGRPDLAQLNQRITVRWHLQPLDRKETGDYVRHRLRVAGGAPATSLFTAGAHRLLYRYSGGVPRLINIVAHRSLLAGFTKEQRTIGAATVRQAIRELRRDDERPRAARAPLLWPAIGAGIVAGFVALAAAFAVVPVRERAFPLPTMTANPATGERSSSRVLPPVIPEAAVATRTSANDLTPTPTPTIALVTTTPPAVSPTPTMQQPLPTGSPIVTGGNFEVGSALASSDPAPGARPSGGVDETTFWGALGATDNRVAALTATDDLLAVWNLEPLTPEERRATSIDLWAIAEKRGVRYLPVSGTMERLQSMNLPAILEIAVPPTQRRRFAVLTNLDDRRALLRYGGTSVTLRTGAMPRFWLGEAHVFWRDFLNLSPYMAPGSVGEDVTKLQQLLARIGEYQGGFSSSYDRTTSEAIARFQRSRRLVADGVVGPLTKILLYEATGAFDHPRLGDTT
jgi:general secretion pathway protein A